MITLVDRSSYNLNYYCIYGTTLYRIDNDILTPIRYNIEVMEIV